jgi:hypothetical protein
MLQVPTPPKQVLTRGGGVPMESETPIISPLEDEKSTPQLAATKAAMWVGIQVPKEIDPGTSIIKPRPQSLCHRKSAFKLQRFFFFVVWASFLRIQKIIRRFFCGFWNFLQGFSHIYFYFLFSSLFSLFFLCCHWFSLHFMGDINGKE